MPTITIEIPKKILQGGTTRRLIAVDPKAFEKELRRKWEEKDVIEAVRVMEREKKRGKLRIVNDLKELMK